MPRDPWELDPMPRKPDCTHAACSYEIRQSGLCGARVEIGKCSLVGRAQPLLIKPSADWIMEGRLLSSHPNDRWASCLRHSFTAKLRRVFQGISGHLRLAKWQLRINCPPVPLSNSKARMCDFEEKSMTSRHNQSIRVSWGEGFPGLASTISLRSSNAVFLFLF